MNIKSTGLTGREAQVMEILWDSDKDLTITEISELSDSPKLTVPCIAQVMPRLLNKGLVRVERFIQANTKYARSFVADISRQDYAESELQKLFRKAGIQAMLNTLVRGNGPD